MEMRIIYQGLKRIDPVVLDKDASSVHRDMCNTLMFMFIRRPDISLECPYMVGERFGFSGYTC